MTRTLQEILLSPERRPQVIEDCQQLVDDEVSSKDGASGMLVKTSYTIAKTVRPDIVKHASDSLLDDFVPRLEPFYASYQSEAAGAPLEKYFVDRSDAIADALLGVTDERAEQTSKASLKKAYEKLRPQAKKHVAEALPNLSKLIEKHANA